MLYHISTYVNKLFEPDCRQELLYVMPHPVVCYLFVTLLLVHFPQVNSVYQHTISHTFNDALFLSLRQLVLFHMAQLERQFGAKLTKNVHLPFCLLLFLCRFYLVKLSEVLVVTVMKLFVGLELFDSALVKNHNFVVIFKQIVRIVQ